jgi:hypothetical protein
MNIFKQSMAANVFLLILVLMLPSGCAGPKHISGGEFKSRYQSPVGSMESASYLGQKGGKAFLSVKRMSVITGNWSERVVFVELSELDPAFRESLPAKTAEVR